jgi:hypothetical protein
MKNPSSVALAGSLVLQAYFTGAREFIEPPSWQPRPFYGPGFLTTKALEIGYDESRPYLDGSHFFRIRRFR